MNILIVGGDRLGNIPKSLYDEGVQEIIHWVGRSKSFFNRSIPSNIDKIVILCDFVSHNIMHNVKKQAKAQKIPIIFSKRNTLLKVC